MHVLPFQHRFGMASRSHKLTGMVLDLLLFFQSFLFIRCVLTLLLQVCFCVTRKALRKAAAHKDGKSLALFLHARHAALKLM